MPASCSFYNNINIIRVCGYLAKSLRVNKGSCCKSMMCHAMNTPVKYALLAHLNVLNTAQQFGFPSASTDCRVACAKQGPYTSHQVYDNASTPTAQVFNTCQPMTQTEFRDTDTSDTCYRRRWSAFRLSDNQNDVFLGPKIEAISREFLGKSLPTLREVHR